MMILSSCTWIMIVQIVHNNIVTIPSERVDDCLRIVLSIEETETPKYIPYIETKLARNMNEVESLNFESDKGASTQLMLHWQMVKFNNQPCL
jgi:predicted nucleic acid-binding protein